MIGRLHRYQAAAIVAALSLAACGGGSTVPSQQAAQSVIQKPGVSQQAQTNVASLQQQVADAVAAAQSDTMPAHPMYAVLHGTASDVAAFAAAGAMPEWNGSFTHAGKSFPFTMIGANPATSNVTTTIPVDIIPVKIVIGSSTFDPNTVLPDGNSVVTSTTNSPLFSAGIDFKSGGTDMGTTQYEDAFQRGNFWSSVKTNTNYHLMLNQTVLAEQTISPGSNGKTGTEFGVKVALIPISYFDTQVKSLITKVGVPAGTLPIFLTYDTYLTSGGCCIGGYHSVTGSHTYAVSTYVGKAAAFAQDVSALSHELGEWVDDPLTNNAVPAKCGAGAILEVGDPLEGDANYGGYPYTLNGFKYNLQDLTYLPYFGAPASTSVNNQTTFQGKALAFCSAGG